MVADAGTDGSSPDGEPREDVGGNENAERHGGGTAVSHDHSRRMARVFSQGDGRTYCRHV